MSRRHHRAGFVRTVVGIVARLLNAVLMVALLPLALPLAAPFLAMSSPRSKARILRAHMP